MDGYTEEELEQQIDAAEDLEERVLMLLLVDSAMRIGECAGLQWSDINLDVGARGCSSSGKTSTPSCCTL